MTPLRIALYQGPGGVPASRTGSLAALDAAARRAAERGARLLITPELALTGYALHDVAAHAEPADGPGPRAVAALAARHGVAVAYGYPERATGTGAVHNSVQLVGPDGDRLADYRKTHLYGGFETGSFTPGDRLVVQADLDGVRLGLLICYDVEFPETVRAHALAGTELLLVPTALMSPYEFVPAVLVPARAWENGLFLAYVNRHGPEGGFEFTGSSTLAAPDGTARVRAGKGETLLIADVDPAELRAPFPANTYLADRRPELYGA